MSSENRITARQSLAELRACFVEGLLLTICALLIVSAFVLIFGFALFGENSDIFWR